MKKFQNLGTALSREQAKKIRGGNECVDCGGGGGGSAATCNCNSDDDCAGNPLKKKCYNGAAYSCTPDPKIGWCEA